MSYVGKMTKQVGVSYYPEVREVKLAMVLGLSVA
jgi:hypothetical protein